MAYKDDTGEAGARRDRGAYLSQAYINAFEKYDEPNRTCNQPKGETDIWLI